MNATQILEATTVSASYTLGDKFRAKNIIAHPCQTRNIFYASTCNLKESNKTFLLEYKEEDNRMFLIESYQNPGIIRKVIPDTLDESRFYTIYSEFGQNNVETTSLNLKQSSVTLQGTDQNNEKSSIFTYKHDRIIHSLTQSKKDHQIILGDKEFLNIFDSDQQKIQSSIQESEKGACICEIDPHHSNLVVSAQNNGNIHVYDLRSQKVKYNIENAHRLRIFDIDFNPNKQYYFQSVGEDYTIKFWDLRNPSLSMKVIHKFNNMPISSKYNKKHDQLMITSFNDGSIGLYRVSSVSSAPLSTQSSQKEEDGLIKIYDEHENTVYSVAWSSGSAWNFASISYYGSVIVNVVPSLVKHRILY